ncbi:MAG: HEAT repeat domain-containing protein [Kofleriaceae bacterium]|nr:HEAT repeat domain-containing protein [Kofleriaceae bacterium]MBP6838084.1 HEAT repeat domain-containing protein [Kofleriaceae bacterium]MBP9204690.1 HEAT repeat domain-containing protein [Kofleriaceae bacterium]
MSFGSRRRGEGRIDRLVQSSVPAPASPSSRLLLVARQPRRGPVALRVLAVLAVLLTAAAPARADRVGDLIGKLRGGSDYKLRLSAALSLSSLGDARGVPALIAALSDGDKNVRAAAAVGLGKLVTAQTKAATRDLAVAALDKAAQKDSADLVRKPARASAEALRALAGASAGSSGGAVGRIFIDLGPMGSKPTEDAQKMKDLMRKTALKTFTKTAKDMSTAWPGGKSPSKADLDKKGVVGFHVDGTLTEMNVKERGAAATVSCKISMLIATFPDKSMFGFLNGGASVSASTSPSDMALAREDCVAAVVEDLVRKKIIPAIETKSR